MPSYNMSTACKHDEFLTVATNSARVIREGRRSTASQRTYEELAPTECCGESPRAFGQRVSVRDRWALVWSQVVRSVVAELQLSTGAVSSSTVMPWAFATGRQLNGAHSLHA